MKLNSFKVVAAAGALFASMLSAQAVGIVGGISLSGDYTFNGTNLANSTAFTSFSDVQVTSTSGSFVGVMLATPGSVTQTPFSFSPFAVGGITPLWTTVAGTAASFNLGAGSVITFQSSTQLLLNGTGTLFLAGFDPTPGLWSFSANTLSSTFSWASSNGAVVPDSGTTALIFGLGLTSLAFAARRFGVVAK